MEAHMQVLEIESTPQQDFGPVHNIPTATEQEAAHPDHGFVASCASCGSTLLRLTAEALHEIRTECIPQRGPSTILNTIKENIHVPFFPPWDRPGWFKNYLFGAHDAQFYENISNDFFAGFTVAVTLIPQALSYASLAKLPPIVGLYSVIMSNIAYILLGTSMQLGVGPVALISLLTGELIESYGIDYENDITSAINFAAQACFCSGLLMLLMGLFNLGNLIRFISHPVMSGFTTAAAMIIGLNQMNSAFGFPNGVVPQVGAKGGAHYNYEVLRWYLNNWNGRDDNGYRYVNVHAASITAGMYVSLAALWLWKKIFVPSAAFKKSKVYPIYQLVVVASPLIAMVIAANQAFRIRHENSTFHAQNLQIVGTVPSGLDIFRLPTFEEDMGSFIVDTIPLTIISYMESFSVAKRIAAAKGQLSTLNPSQELVALGVGNLLNVVSTGYPVSGSFSRSALYASSGAVTLLAKTATLIIVLITIGTLTESFYYVPKAALASIVMVAMLNLLDPMEFWHAWKLSKKDFFVMVITFTLTLVFDTEIGLISGLGLSIVVLLRDLAFSLEAKPFSKAVNFEGVEVIRLNSNLVFISSSRIKDTLIHEIFDKRKEDLKAVVIDFVDVKHADLSGLLAMKDVMDYARKISLLFITMNVLPEIELLLKKSGVTSDSVEECSKELAESISCAEGMVRARGNSVAMENESLFSMQQILESMNKKDSDAELSSQVSAATVQHLQQRSPVVGYTIISSAANNSAGP